MLAHAHQRICGTKASPQTITHQLHPSGISNGEHRSANWSGNAANAARGTYRWASVDFIIPTYSTSNRSAHVSIWAGVGGDGAIAGNPVVVQTGADISPSSLIIWYEVYPGFSEQSFNISSRSGNEIYAYAESNLNNSGYNYFFAENLATGAYNSVYNYGHFSDSAIGECIVERPTINNNFTALLEYNPGSSSHHTETLTSCTVGTNQSSNGIGNLAHFYYSMYDNSGNLLAYPGSISSSGYDYPVYWRASS